MARSSDTASATITGNERMTRPSRPSPALLLAGLLVLVAVAVVGVLFASTTSQHRAAPATLRTIARRPAATVVGTPAARASKARYGGLPSWLPAAKVRVGRIVTATPSHPRLAVEGDTVAVRLPGGGAMTTAVGPAVPQAGRFPVPETTPCQFTVTFAAVRGSVPISAGAFSILGENGQRYAPRLALREGGRLPRRIVAGHPVTLTLSAVLPTGNGQLRWAPLGARPIASWDFAVEID